MLFSIFFDSLRPLAFKPAHKQSMYDTVSLAFLQSYGLSVTTLEEVFLRITSMAAATTTPVPSTPGSTTATRLTKSANQSSSLLPAPTSPPPHQRDSLPGQQQPPEHSVRVGGWALRGQQLRAMVTKRALCARRDKLAVVTQLAVPLLLVGLALWVADLQVRSPQSPPLLLSRAECMGGRAAVMSASQVGLTNIKDRRGW